MATFSDVMSHPRMKRYAGIQCQSDSDCTPSNNCADSTQYYGCEGYKKVCECLGKTYIKINSI